MTAVFMQGNAMDVLKRLPADFFHCAITSPPYFGLRVYDGGIEEWGDGWVGQLGSEPTPELYIQHLVLICQGVKRVLRPDGVFWLNIGDSWNGSGHKEVQINSPKQMTVRGATQQRGTLVDSCKPLDLILIPSLLALALRADGWYVRSVLIWAKGVSLSEEFNGNPMPESVNGWRWERHKVKIGGNGRGNEDWRNNTGMTPQQDHAPDGSFKSSAVWQDCPGCTKCSPTGGFILRKGSWRPTDSYEQVLMLTKTPNYYCDRYAVLEPVKDVSLKRVKHPFHTSEQVANRCINSRSNGDMSQFVNSNGRNLRSVLAVPTAPSGVRHFATYPPKLIGPLIKSATSGKGCCPKCGSPWARVIDAVRRNQKHQEYSVVAANGIQSGGVDSEFPDTTIETIDWLPTCSCPPDDPIPCRVLDPFSGAGTTALVCERLGLDSFNVDTSDEYIRLARERLDKDKDRYGSKTNEIKGGANGTAD